MEELLIISIHCKRTLLTVRVILTVRVVQTREFKLNILPNPKLKILLRMTKFYNSFITRFFKNFHNFTIYNFFELFDLFTGFFFRDELILSKTLRCGVEKLKLLALCLLFFYDDMVFAL